MKKKCTDVGLVAILVSSFLAFHFEDPRFMAVSFALALFTILVPLIFYPIAFCWFGLSQVMGRLSTAVFMWLVFFVVVVPVGVYRKLRGVDVLQIGSFKKGKKSVMVERNHVYTANDFSRTF